MKTKLPPERERSIQKTGIATLALLGIVLHRRNVGGFEDDYGHWVQFADAGQADTYGWDVRTGRHWEIEWKRPGNRPTPAQLDWLRECTRLGAVAFWCDSVAIAERVAAAILKGGKIVWLEGDAYNVRMP